MEITWLGHACFKLASDNGTVVITDPFDEKVGYDLPNVEGDIVTTSHQHFDHNNISIIKGDFIHLKESGKFNIKGIEITGVATYHDEEKGAKRGSNIVFKFNIDGINICHCGDLGHILTSQQVYGLGQVDILLVPVGGTYTVNAEGAMEIVRLLNPKITIPMHFKTPALNFPIDGVDKFLALSDNSCHMNTQSVKIDGDKLSSLSDTIVLDYGTIKI